MSFEQLLTGAMFVFSAVALIIALGARIAARRFRKDLHDRPCPPSVTGGSGRGVRGTGHAGTPR